MAEQQMLLSIVELGGYPDFSSLYRSRGFEVQRADSMRKAIKLLKKRKPSVIVAEFNYQSDFRDRTSSLESLMATVERMPNTRVIVFYEQEQRDKLERLLAKAHVYETLPFPIEEQVIAAVIDRALQEAA